MPLALVVTKPKLESRIQSFHLLAATHHSIGSFENEAIQNFNLKVFLIYKVSKNIQAAFRKVTTNSIDKFFSRRLRVGLLKNLHYFTIIFIDLKHHGCNTVQYFPDGTCPSGPQVKLHLVHLVRG